MRGVGVRQRQGAKRFGWFSISRNGSGAYRLYSRKMKLPARRNSCCAGLRMAETQLKKLFDNNGISVCLTRSVSGKYQVELSAVTVLELIINPNIGGGVARAPLKNLRLS
jgi:hypothetical protein